MGERFADRYRVVALLGRGGMGAVFRVYDEALSEDVALKTLLLPPGRATEALSRFRREVRLSRKVTHPNVARTFDLGVHDGIYYLTMQLVTGGDLASVIADHAPVPARRAVDLTLEMLSGLGAAHAAGIIHRDLKPANVLIDAEGHPVLTDFGIARAIEPSDATVKTGGLLGTPAYMAPEQISGRPADVRTDLYAMGIVLFELLTGRLPFEGATPIATAVARLREDPLDPGRLVTLPEGLGEVVLSCLSREPTARPASATEVAARLSEVDLSTAPSSSTPVSRRSVSTTDHTMMAPSTATTARRDQRLAILPFQYRGPPEHAYLADALCDDLADELALVRGLIVISRGSTRTFKDDRDPRRLRSELGADAVVDGSVQTDGRRIRVAARLDDAASGAQLWNDRFEGALDDVFAVQDTIRRRIAESLRVGLTTATRRGDASAETIELYLRGRSRIRAIQYVGSEGAVALLERALALAPDFAPAVATYAMACVAAWFVPGSAAHRDSEQRARDAVRRALEVAADLAETHQAAGALHLHDGDLPGALQELEAALAIAPNYTDSLETLGQTECEIGRREAGMKRLRLALDLAPGLMGARMELARQAALDGDHDQFEAVLAPLDEPVQRSIAVLQLRVREATYRRDRVAIETLHREFSSETELGRAMMDCTGDIALGRTDAAEAVARAETYLAMLDSPRFKSLVRQILVETLLFAGETALAERQLLLAAESRLIDVEWLDRCPLLADLHGSPALARARELVAARLRGVDR